MPHDDVEKSRFEVANGAYWEIEQSYWKSIKREKQLSYQYSQPAPPTHTTLEQEDSVLVPCSVNLGLSPNKRVVQRGQAHNGGVNTGRVQKRNPKGNNNWTRKKQGIKAYRHQESEQQESSPESSAMEKLARDGELGLPGPSKPTSGKETSLTTLGDGKTVTLRSSDKRAKSKKVADKLHRRAGTHSESGRKSARIEKKQQTPTREYRLRNKIITATVTP